MRPKAWTRKLIHLLSVMLALSVSGASATSDGKVVLAEGSNVNEEVAQVIHQIEAPQVPNRQGLDGLSLQEVMQKFHTPGLSIAVIKDFKIEWAKGYGVADVKTGRPVEINTLFQAAEGIGFLLFDGGHRFG